MRNDSPELDEAPASSSALAALATQLRNGPLQELTELQREAAKLAAATTGSRADRLEDIERLVRLSLSTMEHFHAFTRDFQSVIRGLRDANVETH
jgi:hypothetical protein